jgi:diguanylate cyclase (GGDEF)-like protein
MRYFRIQLDLEIRRSQQLQQSFTLMMMDVDNFKLFNDCYGHLEGDRVLRHLGGLISSVIREQDVACRYGGEEFAVILPGSQPEAAISIHTRLQMALLQWAKQGRAGVPHLITLSVGVAENMPGEGAEDLIERADSAMYAAKQGGRDQLVLSQAGDLAEEVTYQDCYTNY